ncbi:S1/P1 nuclease [Pseudoduganella sp. OTU4001]|uniref:S1/P1 nuclease n=1 Tax=Pseudoduganella sp. OTU4001 TaxID=3043854 RepID=UPI00313DF759
MKKIVLIAALAGAFAANNAMAWGNAGHRIVGAIADNLLKGTNAEKQIAALLLQGENLEKVANWADCVKGTFCGPQSQEMNDYVAAHPKHTEYHYTDVPFQLNEYHLHGVGTAEHDIVQTMQQCIATLQGKGDGKFTPRQALLILTHLAGDIHQPLHVGAAFVDKDGKFVVPKTEKEVDSLNIFDSRGGNNLQMDEALLKAASAKVIPGEDAEVSKYPTKPFHSYWDTTVVDYAMRRSSQRTVDGFTKWAIDGKPIVTLAKGDVSTWPVQWANDSLAVSKQAYADVKVGLATKQTSRSGSTYTVWAMTVPDNYPVPSSAIAREQLIKGGYNLAAMLQKIWP